MKNYFKHKNIEFSILTAIIFLSMCIFFQIVDVNISEVAKDSSIYLYYIVGLFGFYLYLAIKSRINYINYFKENKKVYYDNIDNKYRVLKLIHKYFPIFLFGILLLSQNYFNYEIYLVWFYFLIVVLFVLLIAMFKFSKIIIRNEEK